MRKNGSGKTNILESISLLTSNYGLKKSNLKEIINNKFLGPIELFGVNILFKIKNRQMKVGIGIKKNQNSLKKIFNIDGLKSNMKIENFLNIFSIVPKTTFLFQNRPEDRRNFLDQMISSIDLNFKKYLSSYEKYKSERFKILKKWNVESQNWLCLVEKKLASVGIVICDARRNFIKELNRRFDKSSKYFPSIELKLNGELDTLLKTKPAVDVEEFFLKKLEENRKKDILTGKTNFSANKTDLIAYQSKTMQEAKNHSTGEQKIIVFSIIFSFLKLLESKSDLKVIFLLDDVFSFLDKNHILMVLDKLNELNIQTWLTDIRGEWITKNSKFRTLIQKINIDDKRFKLNNI